MKKIYIIQILVVLFFSCSSKINQKNQPVVQKGVLNLNNWDFEKDGPIEIKGEWEFYWERLVTPSDLNKLSHLENDKDMIKVPGTWNNHINKKKGNEKISSFGYATYLLKIQGLHPDTSADLALKIRDISTAYKLYYVPHNMIDGPHSVDLNVISNGKVGDKKTSSIPHFSQEIGRIKHSSDTNYIIMQVSNFHHRRGGFWNTLYFGLEKDLRNQEKTQVIISSIVIGIMLIMGLYHLLLFIARHEDKASLLLGLFSILLVFRLIVTGGIISNVFPISSISFEIIRKIEYITLYLCMQTFYFYLYYAFKSTFMKGFINKYINYFALYYYLLITIFTLISPLYLYSVTVNYTNLFTFVIMIYCCIKIIQAVIQEKFGAVTSLIGFIVFFTTFIIDMLYVRKIIILYFYTVPFGVAFLILMQSYFIAKLFARSHRNAEDLNIKLKDMNLNLENIVNERTVELTARKNELEKDLRLAKKIQNNLIPWDIHFPNIAAFYKPMEEVGGDFYDFIRFRDSEQIGIFVSDVSGHGVSAAFITSMIKTIILESGPKKDDPAELLFQLNNILHDNIARKFITAFYGIFNPSDRTLHYSNAGHYPPFIITNEVVELACNWKPALGIFDNKVLKENNKIYENHEMKLPLNSKVLIYTDGLTETRPVGENGYFQDLNMIDVFIENRGRDCGEFTDRLFEELVRFRRSETFDDDICFVCLDVK